MLTDRQTNKYINGDINITSLAEVMGRRFQVTVLYKFMSELGQEMEWAKEMNFWLTQRRERPDCLTCHSAAYCSHCISITVNDRIRAYDCIKAHPLVWPNDTAISN